MTLLVAGLSEACRAVPGVRGPIVLVTVAGVRWDAVGPRSRLDVRTPALDLLDAQWRGSAVAASSEPVAALASLLCGVNPWQHQLLAPEHPERRRFPTIAQVLRRAGYRSRAYVPEELGRALGEGFDLGADPASDPAAVAREMASDLADGDFVWIHYSDADLARRRRARGRGGKGRGRTRLLVYADPEHELSPDDREGLWQVYANGVERVDRQVQELLEALRGNAPWERATVVITGSHGTELGEHGQILYGENLGRETIEVPLRVRLGDAAGPLAEPAGTRVAQTRLFSTMIEIAGLEAPPVHPPSLLRLSDAPVLSELYGGNGVNRFSLVVAAELQLHWTTRFAPSEPEYHLARQVIFGGRARQLSETPQRIFDRLDDAFRRTPPLAGEPGSEPELALERWSDDGVELLAEPDTARQLAVALRRQWTRFVDRERPPEEEWQMGHEAARDDGLTMPSPDR